MNSLPPAMAGILKTEPAILYFSGGKDSIVSGDLVFRSEPVSITPVFLYFVAGLKIKQKILDYYAKKWNTEIRLYPHPRTMNLKSGKKYRLSDITRNIRVLYNVSWVIDGSKKTDSMARRGMMARLPDGIDERNKYMYPLADWNDRKVMAYIKLNRLPLPVEYQHGFTRDFSFPTVEKLIYLKNNFPGDYAKVIAEFPQIEAQVWAEEN